MKTYHLASPTLTLATSNPFQHLNFAYGVRVALSALAIERSRMTPLSLGEPGLSLSFSANQEVRAPFYSGEAAGPNDRDRESASGS